MAAERISVKQVDPGLLDDLATHLCAVREEFEALEQPEAEGIDLVAWLSREPGTIPECDLTLDRLRKKIEVARVLYRFYTDDLEKGLPGDHLPEVYVYYLVGLLLNKALVDRNYRYLNTVLKIRDGVLVGQPLRDFPDVYHRSISELLAVLSGELK